jgi:acetyl-CoA acetyltransferase
MTRFARNNLHFREMGRQAVWAAIQDAAINPRKIQIAYAGHARTGQLLGWECGVGQAILWEVGINKIPVTSVGNFCCSGTCALREAWIAVGSGLYDVAIAIGVEKLSMRKGKGRPLTSDGVELEGGVGFTPPVFFAMIAQRHMELYGTTKEQIATVSVKNRKYGALNPFAQYQKEVTLEEVLTSPLVVDPLTLYQCCPTSDGAAAAILCAKDVLGKYTTQKPVTVAAIALQSGSYPDSAGELTVDEGTVRAAQEAYQMAGLGPEDIDVAEVHDCFSIAEVIHYEDLGWCKKGEGGRFVQEGYFDLGGKVAVNPSGGLLSKGHPLGATGIGQLSEIVWHLRGEAGARQRAGARVGLTHNAGGIKEADVTAITVSIFKT